MMIAISVLCLYDLRLRNKCGNCRAGLSHAVMALEMKQAHVKADHVITVDADIQLSPLRFDYAVVLNFVVLEC